MNSRGAYDDAEVLRMVIEESKGDNATNGSENGTRKGKRNRDDSSDECVTSNSSYAVQSSLPDNLR